MRLSQKTIDSMLNIIANFDRIRGIPHDYVDLDYALRCLNFEVCDDKLELVVAPEV